MVSACCFGKRWIDCEDDTVLSVSSASAALSAVEARIKAAAINEPVIMRILSGVIKRLSFTAATERMPVAAAPAVAAPIMH